MLNFDFKRSSRKCSQTDRPIQPGEEFYSALVDVDETTQRLDVCDEAWQGPPENCIGWWKSRVPVLEKGKIYWAPREVMLAYFEHLLEHPDQSDTTYVTALLLIQKKILTLEDSILPERLDEETPATILRVRDRRNKQNYDVTEVEVAAQRLGEIQEELAERLFTDQVLGEDDDEEAEEAE